MSSATPVSLTSPAGFGPVGSRRRRLWELGAHAHCPVIGVCLPMAALRRLAARHLGGEPLPDDYELHCGLIAQCRQRTPMAEQVQKELDRRYALPLQRSARAKHEAALADWWREASGGQDLAGALWATLTHAHCTPALEQRVLGEVHMLQHQLGMATRVELARFEGLIDENAVLARELGAAQRRCSAMAADHARQVDALHADLVRLRAELIARDTALAQQREQLAQQSADPDLQERIALARQLQMQAERIDQLQRELQRAEEAAERQRRRTAQPTSRLAVVALPSTKAGDGPVRPAVVTPAGGEAPLQQRAVLCVGGRSSGVPVYRRVVERSGGRFLHHDGGDEDSSARLDATLAAADLVICQTGCISHDAYWRVKEHCKRTGKRCVFVETPSRAALQRALAGLGQPDT